MKWFLKQKTKTNKKLTRLRSSYDTTFNIMQTLYRLDLVNFEPMRLRRKARK